MFIFGFDLLLPDSLSHLQLTFLNPTAKQIRQKRWVWTAFASDISGLATKDQVETMVVNQANIIQHDKQIDEDLVNLHNESIDILNHVSKQAVSLKKTFSR